MPQFNETVFAVATFLDTNKVTCSQDSSRLSFMLANRLFSSSTSLISFLRSICNTKFKSDQKTTINYHMQ